LFTIPSLASIFHSLLWETLRTLSSMNIARALTIDGTQSVSESELYILAEMASRYRNIVEVGSFKGRSARAMADNTNGKLTCIDPWNGLVEFKGYKKEVNGYTPEFIAFKKNLEDHILSGKVDYYKGKFQDFYIPYPDMVFIDAIHEYDSVIEDITHSLKLMGKHGLICGHDYADYWPGVIKAVDEIFPNKQVEETIWYVEL
jgi:hypothetical protein